jgi:hypothetical protein
MGDYPLTDEHRHPAMKANDMLSGEDAAVPTQR